MSQPSPGGLPFEGLPPEGLRALPEGLRAWVALPGPAALVLALRERASRGNSTETGRLNCRLDESERREVGRLLGTQWVLSGSPVTLDRLTVVLAPYGITTRELAEAVGGPIPDRRRERAEALATAVAEREQAVALLVEAGVPAEVAEQWTADPALPRPGGGELVALALRSAEIWRSLPGPAGVPVRLAALSAEHVGDAHALDADRPLGRAVAKLAAAAGGLERPVRGGRAWRDAWASVGVLCDSVSSRVLALNLPLTGDAAAVRLCSAAAELGEPVWLTLRSLADPWSAPAGTVVHVCENPTVVEAAADRLGTSCPPVVCTDGMPTTTAVDLVRGLASAGCVLRLRADVDGAGLAIVRTLLNAAPRASLWRYDLPSYEVANYEVASYEHELCQDTSSREADAGSAIGDLAAAFAASGRVLHEEHLLGDLLADLADLAELAES